MKVEQIVSMIKHGMLSSIRPDLLHAALKKKGDVAYEVLSAMESYTDAPVDSDTKSITAHLLDEYDDPLLAGRALRVLVIAWELYEEYRDEILRAIRGVDWDESGDYRLSGVLCAGFLLAKTIDEEILAAVLDRLLDSAELSGTREAARDAISRAMGKTSKEIVEKSVRLDRTYLPSQDEAVVWARQRLPKSSQK
jgi:hypothetical protein